MGGMVEEGGNVAKVRVDGEEAVLHLTDQSVMFEKGGRVSGFLRSAVQMVKPDGDAMIIAYSAGSVVESVRVEPMAAVASLLVPSPNPGQSLTSMTGLGEVFDKLYVDTRKELEERLAKVQGDPKDGSLRLTPSDDERYSQISRQMEGIIAAKYRFDPRAEDNPVSFWGLEKQPYEIQLAVVKIRHIRFLRMMVDSTAERSDVVFASDEVWPEDWPGVLGRFNLDRSLYTTKMFDDYVSYLKSQWKYRPGARKPVLASS